MADELGKIQILLEGIKSDIKAVAEGHAVLNKKIETEAGNIRKEFNEQFSDVKLVLKEHSEILKEHSETLKDIQHDLKTHIRQTAPPAHVSF